MKGGTRARQRDKIGSQLHHPIPAEEILAVRGRNEQRIFRRPNYHTQRPTFGTFGTWKSLAVFLIGSILIECGDHNKISSRTHQKRVQFFCQINQYYSLHYENGGRTAFCRLFGCLVKFLSVNTARISWYPSRLWQVRMVLWGRLLELAFSGFDLFFQYFILNFSAKWLRIIWWNIQYIYWCGRHQ